MKLETPNRKVTTMTDKEQLTVSSFQAMKLEGRKIVMVTAYDYAMGRAVSESGIDLILVGDSLGMVMLGYETTLQVSMADMVHHSSAVRRGAPSSFIIADMPFMSYHSVKAAKLNAAELVVKGGGNAVKLEGGSQSRIDAVKAIVDCEIPVCAHIGLTPQSVHRFGGYKVQGKTVKEHDELLRQARDLEQAGAFMLVLEGIPELLGKEITQAISIPTIGIGAGRHTDGQVLVWHDLLGMGTLKPKFVKSYADLGNSIPKALRAYASEVRDGAFPSESQVYYPIKITEEHQ